jgi:hypothetical protein
MARKAVHSKDVGFPESPADLVEEVVALAGEVVDLVGDIVALVGETFALAALLETAEEETELDDALDPPEFVEMHGFEVETPQVWPASQ